MLPALFNNSKPSYLVQEGDGVLDVSTMSQTPLTRSAI